MEDDAQQPIEQERKTMKRGGTINRLLRRKSSVKKAPMENTRINGFQCALYWDHLNYYLDERKLPSKIKDALPCTGNPPPGKQILFNVGGYVLPGQMLAIIGSSGAGKTTMLNILAKRARGGVVEGTLEVNGVSILPDSRTAKYQRLVGYVLQHDALLPFLTVQETLIYNAMLTLPRKQSLKQKMARVNSLIEELGLTKCRFNYVGNELVRGISGGEKKRLSIGLELLRDPAILFLDEPTSGLDAKTALGVCEHLARLAHVYNHTVITTIHQPRAQIFSQFDLLLILAPGGRQIYFGPAANTMAYFEAQGLSCPIHENPADYFIDCTTVDFRSTADREESETRIKELADSWESNTDMYPTRPDYSKYDDYERTDKSPSATWLSQVFWIAMSSSSNELRNTKFIIARFMQNAVIAVLLGLLYLNIDNDQSTIADRNGILFFSIISISFNELYSALAVFATERVVFFRERDSGTYYITAYWVAKQISLLPYQIAFPSVFIVIVYFMVGLQDVWYKFFIFYATIVLVGLWTGSIGLTLGASLPPTIAAAIAPLNNILAIIFAGFLVNLGNIPAFIRWLQWISYAKYAFDCVVQNEFNGLKLKCSDDELVGIERACPVTRGEQVVSQLDITELDYWADLLILLAFVVVGRLLLLWALLKARPTGQ